MTYNRFNMFSSPLICDSSFCLFVLCFWDRLPYIPGWPPLCCIVKDDLELLILLLPLPKYWNHRHDPPCQGTKFRASFMLSNNTTNWITSLVSDKIIHHFIFSLKLYSFIVLFFFKGDCFSPSYIEGFQQVVLFLEMWGIDYQLCLKLTQRFLARTFIWES